MLILAAVLITLNLFWRALIFHFYLHDSRRPSYMNMLLILIWVTGWVVFFTLPPPTWFCLITSETVKVVTLAFCSIQ